MKKFEAKRIISGTFGEMWLDGNYVGECYGLQLKVSYNKEDVQLPGQIMTDTKLKSAKGTGTIKYYKVNSRMAQVHGRAVREGRDTRFTIISKLDDPDAYGAERVQVTGVSFDDIIIADWESGNMIKHDAPLTFADYDYLDMIEVQ